MFSARPELVRVRVQVGMWRLPRVAGLAQVKAQAVEQVM
jgi:hypothetical protein